MFNRFSAVQVRSQKKPGLHADGGGLYLRITPKGWRGWIFRYRSRTTGKLRDMGLGPLGDVSLRDARKKAATCRAQLLQGESPIDVRRAEGEAKRLAAGRRITFAEAARHCHAVHAAEFRSIKHRADWLSSLERIAFPVLGEMHVPDITTVDVLRALQPIWTTRTETAQRTRQRIETVLDWATVYKYRQGANPARWRGNLKELLPRPGRLKKERHQPALPWRELPGFMADLRARRGIEALALRFTILTASRSQEVRDMHWDEIDGKVWTVPAERMKRGKLHRVPLSRDALALLASVPHRSNDPRVFSAARGGQLSSTTLSEFVHGMDADNVKRGGAGYRDPRQDNRVATPHGIARSCFKDWARNATRYADEVSELALAHMNSDATRAAYARDELLSQRARLMTGWAAFCRSGLRSGTGIPRSRHNGRKSNPGTN